MIEAIPFEKIDQKKWNNCVQESEHKNIYGLYDSICTACDHWIGIVYNDYEAIMALPMKKKLGLSYSWHPQFMGPLGIFGEEVTTEIRSKMFATIIEHSWWIKMHYWQDQSEIKEIKTTERIYQQLDLADRSMDNIRLNYNDNTKRNLKKAIKQNLSIRKTDDSEQLILVFKENKGDQIKNIKEESYVLLKKLTDHWIKKGMGHIMTVYAGSDLAAIGCFLTWGKRLIYYKGAVTEAGKTNGAMHYLIDQEIELHLSGCSSFDFGGSNTESVARFYKGFGGTDRMYYLHEYKKFKI